MPGIDPFIFAAYHQDHYPKGNGRLGPDAALLRGRDIGMDFSGRDGWSMYHGEEIPAFRRTRTVLRNRDYRAPGTGGPCRFAGCHGALRRGRRAVADHRQRRAARRDVPAGARGQGNTLDLFQIWLNLPAKNKLAPPDFTMFWAHTIPRVTLPGSEVEVIAGNYGAVRALPPPRASWASEADADVAIWIVRIEPGASVTLSAASDRARRAIYLTTGRSFVVGGQHFDRRVMVEVRANQPAPLHNDSAEVIELLVLQGKPIGEPVAARGPFVMNTQEELVQTIRDYQRTEFGGWPWPSREHTHGTSGRFAQHPGGRVERPEV